MEFLARLVDLLKASGVQTGALALGAFGYIWLSQRGIMPALEGKWLPGVSLFGVGAAALCAASAVAFVFSSVKAFRPVQRWWQNRRFKADFIANLDNLSFRERQILGFLCHHNQKVFTTDFDGGHAASLIARGYLQHFAAPGQRLPARAFPTRVVQPVWELMKAVPEAFPYEPQFDGDGEIPPWRRHWMER